MRRGGEGLRDLKASEFKPERRLAHLAGVLMEESVVEVTKSRFSPRNTVIWRP